MRRDACDMDLPTLQVDEKQHVVRYEPTQRPDLGREKVRRDQHVQMRTDELLPRRGRLTFWSWWDAVALENVTYGLITHGVSQVGQGTHDAIIAPRAIVPGHTDNQGFQLRVDFGTAGRLPLLGAVTLLGDQFAVP